LSETIPQPAPVKGAPVYAKPKKRVIVARDYAAASSGANLKEDA
jgi:hypothetical protein